MDAGHGMEREEAAEDNNGIRTPIGMKVIVEKRGLLQNCTGKYSKSGKDIVMREMVEVLSDCEDFRNEKCIVQKIVEDRGHLWVPLPKFHPELSPIEPMWMMMKLWTRRWCKYNFPSLKKTIPKAKLKCNVDYIRKSFLRVHAYEEAYRKGLSTVDVFKAAKKSHRGVLKL